MNTKKLVLTIIVIFVLANITGFLIHAVLLAPDYMTVKEHYRAEGSEKMIFICLAYLAFAIGSVFAYAKGVENKPWLGQGLRFGIILWLILTVPSFFIAYADGEAGPVRGHRQDHPGRDYSCALSSLRTSPYDR
jgi:hypothetical protein